MARRGSRSTTSPVSGWAERRPGPSRNPPSGTEAIELVAQPGGLGQAQWIGVSSLSPGTYRLRQTVDLIGQASPSTDNDQPRQATATGEFQIADGGAPQAPPLESDARIEPQPAVVNGAAGPLVLHLVGGTGDLNKDAQVEQSLSLTVHIRRWHDDRWADVATRRAFRVDSVTTGVSLPRLSPGLYELTRTLPSGRGAINGWLFVTHAIRFKAPPTRFICRVSLGKQSKTVVVGSVTGESNSAAIGPYAARFKILIPPTNGFGFMRVDLTGPTLGSATHAEGGFSTQTDAFTGRVATPAGRLSYVCGA